MITKQEFKKSVYHTRTKVVIPCLGIKVDKVDFFIKGKFNSNKLDDYLELKYEEKYGG